MKRGDIVTVALPVGLGRPRPAVVIQADEFDRTGTCTVLLISGTSVDTPLIRLQVQPTARNGLRKPSQIMVDMAMSSRREKIGETIGRLEDETMLAVTRSLAVFLGIV